MSAEEKPPIWGHVASECLGLPHSELPGEAASLLVLSPELNPQEDTIRCW